MKQSLPIDPYIPEILSKTSNYSTVLVKASPGSGKTSRLPWAIAKGLGKKVAVLEPRRLAAKLAALRIAEEEELELGREIGYHFRFEKVASPQTQVTFYTEGTFLRTLKDSHAEVVILDEFHERHLETDLALALVRGLQTEKNLKIILMSATLDPKLIDYFDDAKLFEVEAPMYPVEVRFLPNQPSILSQTLEAKVKKAVSETSGDTLVFLPGMREMLSVQSALTGELDVFLLHADLPKEEQERALRKNPRRKIILATNIAESSVTIPGITAVIDSGIQREAVFSPWNGLRLIEDNKTTKSSAIQRAGRAGRTGPGICVRLYSEQDFNERDEFTVAEIEKADLTDTYLFVTGFKLTPRWFQAPDQEKWRKARELLEKLGAVAGGTITDLGKKILSYPVDSRLGRILVAGEDLPVAQKDKLLSYLSHELEDDRGQLKRRLSAYLRSSGSGSGPWEKCILMGFLDQVARFRKKQRDFIHYSGKILKAHPSLDLEDGLYLVLDITRRQEAIKILEIHDDWLWDVDPFPFSEETELKVEEKISLRSKTMLGRIVMEEEPRKLSWAELPQATKAKLLELARAPVEKLTADWKETDEFQRLSYWFKARNLTPDLSLDLEAYFSTFDLTFEHVVTELKAKLKFEEMDLPASVFLGGRKELKIHYSESEPPYLEAPIQEFYGHNETPTIMNGQVTLTLKLLGPHKRPIQVTRDLKNFWQRTYQEMKKEYSRDYPRHYWPDRPWEAKPYLLKSHLPKV